MSDFAFQLEAAIADKLCISIPTLRRWLAGTSEPHEAMKTAVFTSLGRKKVYFLGISTPGGFEKTGETESEQEAYDWLKTESPEGTMAVFGIHYV